MSRKGVIEEGLRRLNTGGNLEAWGRSARVGEVNDLARLVGVTPRQTKAATVSAIARAPRPALVDEGLSALTSGRSLRAWGRRVRVAEVSALARKLGLEPQRTKAATLDAIQEVAEQAKIATRQTKTIPARVERVVVRADRLFERARLQLFEDLVNVTADDVPGRLRGYHRAIRRWGNSLKAAMKAQLARSESDMHGLATRHFAELFEGFTRATSRLASLRALRQFAAAVDKLAAEMAIRLTRLLPAKVQQSPLRTARELAGSGRRSIVNTYRHRVRLTARMEALRAYNEAQLAIAQAFPVPRGKRLRKRIVEIFDPRNHPFSRAANGTVAAIDKPFRVPVASVQRMAAAMSKSAGGVFWNVKGGDYVGMSLPAHYNDRARVVVELVAS